MASRLIASAFVRRENGAKIAIRIANLTRSITLQLISVSPEKFGSEIESRSAAPSPTLQGLESASSALAARRLAKDFFHRAVSRLAPPASLLVLEMSIFARARFWQK